MKKQTRTALAARSAAMQVAARQALAGMDAVPVLKRHFGAVLGTENVKIDEEEFIAYIAASSAIVHNKLALQHLGLALVDMLLAHFKRQVDAVAQAQEAPR